MRTLIALTLLAVMISACGIKGPLYLPKPKPAAVPASTGTQSGPAETSKKP